MADSIPPTQAVASSLPVKANADKENRKKPAVRKQKHRQTPEDKAKPASDNPASHIDEYV